MNKTMKKARTLRIIKSLEGEYAALKSELNHTHPYELLMAVRLSAQCTDARVNIVTKDLFEKYQSLRDFAEADLKDMKKMVYSTGFYNRKAQDLIEMSKMLIEEYDGQVPKAMEDLLKLPGVGRKTANLVRGDIFDLPAVVADTHCIRITNLLGLTDSKNPDIVERQLLKILPPDKSNDFCHRMVLHGRAVCVARRPDCENCVLKKDCDYYLNLKKE